MLRRLVIVVLLFTSLFTQVGTAYACSMMGEVVKHDCCCDGDAGAPGALHQSDEAGAADDCCRPLVLIGDREGEAEAGAHRPPFDPETWPLLAVAVSLLAPPAPPPATAPSDPRATPGGSGTHTWLHTRRLRI